MFLGDQYTGRWLSAFFDNGTNQYMVNILCRTILTSSWTAGGFVFTAEVLMEWMDAFFLHKIVLSTDALKQMLTFAPVQLNQNTYWNGCGQGSMRQPLTINLFKGI